MFASIWISGEQPDAVLIKRCMVSLDAKDGVFAETVWYSFQPQTASNRLPLVSKKFAIKNYMSFLSLVTVTVLSTVGNFLMCSSEGHSKLSYLARWWGSKNIMISRHLALVKFHSVQNKMKANKKGKFKPSGAYNLHGITRAQFCNFVRSLNSHS